MRVLAVIPAWNGRARLGAVLAALAGQVERVIVVDNGSVDGTAAWLSGEGGKAAPVGPPRDIVANAENAGYPAAVNQGLALALAAGADAVLVVNDDAVFGPGAVAALSHAMSDDAASGAASAHMVYRDRPDVVNGTGGRFDRHRGHAALRGAGEPDCSQYADRPTVDYPSGAASLLRRAAIEEVGAFDERFYLYFEDADWGLRALALGWRTIYVPEARVVHVGSAGTADDPARRRYYNVRNRLLLARRHASRRGQIRAWLDTLWLLARQPARMLTPWRRRDAAAVWWGVADHLRGRYGRSARFG